MDEMDPKLQYFLDATGWSKQDLIRKLSAGENTTSTAITEIDCVTSTTSYKSNCIPQKKINELPSFSAILARQVNLTGPHHKSKIQTGTTKTSKHIDKNVEIINVDLDCDESVPENTSSSSLSEDLLCHLNTSSSYLPPLFYTQSPKRSKGDKSAVIDLVSDTESLDPQENNSDRLDKDEAVIDISTDSEDSVKSESFNDQDVGDARAKKSNNSTQIADSVNKSKSTESRNEPNKRTVLLNNRLKDRDHNSDDQDPSSKSLHKQDRNGSEYGGSSRDSSRYQDRQYRHRSSSSNRHSNDRLHRKTARNRSRSKPRRYRSRSERSRSRSKSRRGSRDRSRSKPRRYRSRSERSRSRSESRRGSRDRSRSKPRRYRSRSERSRSRSESRRRSRDRNRNDSHSRRISSGSRSNRSKSKSVDRGYKYSRKRSRSRSGERDAKRQCKISKTTDKSRARRKPIYSAEDMQRMNVHASYYGKELTPPKFFSHDSAVFAESTMTLKDVALRLKNGTYKKRKSLPCQLNVSNDLSENKSAHSKTCVTFKNIASEENPEFISKQKRSRNKSFEDTGAGIGHRMNQSAKKFIESKDKNLATEVSQLISSTDRSECQPSMLTKHKNDSLGSNDAIEHEDLLTPKRMDVANNPSTINTTNINSNNTQYPTNIFDSEKSGFHNQLSHKIHLNISDDASLTMLNAEKKRLEDELNREAEDNIQQKTRTSITSDKVDIVLSKKINITISTSIESKPLPPKSISEISCKDAPIQIGNVAKSRDTFIENLSDISDCTSDELADEVEMIAKKYCSSDIRKKSDPVPTSSNATNFTNMDSPKMLLLENMPKDSNATIVNKISTLKLNTFDLGKCSDSSDCTEGDITDNMYAPSTIKDDSKDLHYKDKNNSGKSQLDLKKYNTSIDQLTDNAETHFSKDLSENGRNEIIQDDSFHITTAEETLTMFSSSDEIEIDDEEDKNVKFCIELLKGDNDIDSIVHSQELQPSLAEDPLVKLIDNEELMEQRIDSQSSTAENVSTPIKHSFERPIDMEELIKKPVESQSTIAKNVSALTEFMKPTEDLPIESCDKIEPQLEANSKISDNPSDLPTHKTETALMQPIEDLSTDDNEKIDSRPQLEPTDDTSEVLNIESSSITPREDLPNENVDEIISNSKLLFPISENNAKGSDCLLTKNVESTFTKPTEYLTENDEDEIGNSEQEHFSIIEDISPMESVEDIPENSLDEIVNSLDSHNSTTEASEVDDDTTAKLVEDSKQGVHVKFVETDAQIHQQFEVEAKADKMALENSYSENAVIEDGVLETLKIKNNNSLSEMHDEGIEVDNANVQESEEYYKKKLSSSFKDNSGNMEMEFSKVSEDDRDQQNLSDRFKDSAENMEIELSKISKDADERNLPGSLKDSIGNMGIELSKVSEDHDQQILSDRFKDSSENMGLELTNESSRNCRESELEDPDSKQNSLSNGIQNIHDSPMDETYSIQNESPVKHPVDNIEKTDLVQKSIIETEKSTIAEHISEISDDDTPSLDIEAILKKCKDVQERALNKPQEGPEDKVPSSVVRVRPKNRRPNFSSLRDKSISTIHINMFLEKLSYNDMRPGTSASSLVLQKDNDDNNFISKDSSASGNLIERPISIQSKYSGSKVMVKSKTSEKILSQTNIIQKEFKDLDKSLYDNNVNDNIRIEILKQLDILRNQRNDAAFTTSINPTTISKGIRKKTLAKLRDPITDHKDDEEIEEINIINDDLNLPILWLTKTTDYKKIKGWKNKAMGIKAKKCTPPAMNAIAEDFAVPSCSFHYPSVVDDIIENVVADNLDEIKTVNADHTESKIEEDAEKNAFSSSMLDEFLLDKSEVELKISYEVPMLLMGPKIDTSPKVNENLLKGDVKYKVGQLIKYDPIPKEGTKPRTVAEKRKLFLQEHNSVITAHSIAKQSTIFTPPENYRNPNRSVIKTSINDDLPNTGHNKRKDFAVGSVYWKGKKYVVPCRVRKTIYFRSKVASRYSPLNSYKFKEDMVTILNPNDSSPIRNEEPPKAILWSPDKMVRKSTVRSVIKDISYKAGPMCKKPDLISGTTNFWKCIVKPLPKIFLEITAEYGKSLHPRALQFLYAQSEVKLSKEKVEFALTALKDSKPTKFMLPVSYENGQTQFTLRQRQIIETSGTKSPPVCGDISSEIQEIVDDLLTCLEIQAIQDTIIKDDPDLDTEEPAKQMSKSPSRKDTKESPVTTKVAGINRQLRLALGRLQVKFIDINIDEDDDPNRICDKTYCQLGCVCSSLSGALPSKEHCRRIECVFGCICGYKPPINTTVTLPAGSDLDLFSTVDKLQSEATKNLAKVEKEFTQTIVCTKNETYVLGDTVDRRRRCTRAPKKYEDFLEARDATKNNEEQKHSKEESHISYSERIRNNYGVDIAECSVRIEKVDMYHIIPFCWRHELYQCQCLKEFLIARSQEKANNLALQLDYIEANKKDNEDTRSIRDLLGSTWSKFAMRKKVKKISKKYSRIKRFQLKLKLAKSIETSKALNMAQDTLKSPGNYNESTYAEMGISGIESDSSDLITTNRSNISVPKLVQQSHQSKSSRRKQVLSTMVDVNEKATIQVRKLRNSSQSTKLLNNKSKQNVEPDSLRFLVPTSNVRLQFLKMLRKPTDAKDEFRLLSFMLLSDRFNRRLFHVWYSRAAITSKYILTMDSMRPSPEFKNVRFFGADFKTDNYLIQWLMEGSIPMTAVQDFLVILRIINSKQFEICGMCEKSKIEYTDEALPSLVQTSPVSSPPKVPVGPSVPFNVSGSPQQERKILNIQNKKIPAITCTYPSVALTGQSGLFHASLPSINAKYRWFMLTLSSTFAVLNMTTTNYCIPHEFLVEIVEKAKITNSTTMFKNKDIRGRAIHADFAIYVAPQHKKYFFIGPYQINEELTCETLCYYKNMLVSTENFNKIHGNPEIPVGTWIKQVQMKIHSTKSMKVAPAKVMQVSAAKALKVSSINALKVASVNTAKASLITTMKVPIIKTMSLLPTTTYLKPLLPKPSAPAPSPPQLLRISDFMAAKKGRYAFKLAKEMPKGSPRTSLLIVNNNFVSSSLTTIGANKITVGSVGAMKSNFEIITSSATSMIGPVVSPKVISSTTAGLSSPSSSNNTTDDPLFINHNVNEDIRVLGLDYRDAEFIDKSHKTLQFLVTNIPGFGYIRIYRCQKTNYIYLMWRFVKMYKTLIEAKRALIHLIESTVIIVPSNFKIMITLLNAKPNNLKLINSDYYFDTYIAGRFGVHLLSNLNMSMMVDYLKINEEDAAYIKEKSSGMLLKKCYNIASTFLTKDDLSKIRNWNDMMSSLKGTIDFERQTTVKLTDILRDETSKNLALQTKLDNLRKDSEDSVEIINITPVKATSEVIEISDEDDNDDEIKSMLQSNVTTEGANAITPAIVTRRPMVQQIGEIIQTSNSSTITTNTQQRTVGFVSMAQNFKGSFKLMPHNQNSVLITRIKTQPATTKMNTNDL